MMNPAPTRIRRVASRLAAGHFPALAALTLVHFSVFARALLRRRDGALTTHVPWDFEDSYHRYLVYISDCLHAHSLPLWYPYGSAGSPFYINPQNQMWSPVTWIMTVVFGYSHHVAQRQLIWTLLIAGFGAYFLAHRLWQGRLPALFSGLCFMLTGAVFTNLQHLDIINAWALAPWLFLTMLRMTGQPWRSAPALVLVIMLLLTSGYPGVVMMLALWGAAAAIYISFASGFDWPARRRFLGACLAAASLSLVMAGGLWLPVLSHLEAFTRGDGLDLTMALSGSLAPIHFLGLVFPFSVDASWAGFAPDVSMRGLYLGVLAVPFLVLALARSKEPMVGPIAAVAVIALFMSAGASFFPRIALHTVFPAFNYSRFPAADSRALAILAAALVVAAGVKQILILDPFRRDVLVRWFLALSVAMAIALVGLRILVYPDANSGTFNDKVVGPTMLQIVLLLTAAVVAHRASDQRTAVMVLAGLLAIDLGSGVMASYRTVGETLSAEEYSKRSAVYDQRFDPSAANRPRLVTGKNLFDPQAGAGYLSKRFYLSDYTPFRLRSFDGLLQRGFQDWLATGPRVVGLPVESNVDSAASFTSAQQPIAHQITGYTCDTVDYTVKLDRKTLLVFNEVYFPGWKATVDGSNSAVVQVAGGLRGLVAEPGEHRVRTYFRPRDFYIGLIATVVGWIAFMGWAVAAFVLGRRARRREVSPSVP
jgi:hypothetical protein